MKYTKEMQLGKQKKGVKIPPRSKRSEFTKKDRKRIIDLYGEHCQFCFSPYVEFHHRKYRSQSGRNNPRNGAPLCHDCHKYVHENVKAAEFLRNEAIERFGPDYYKDKYDLWREGKISDPDDSLLEKYFRSWGK